MEQRNKLQSERLDFLLDALKEDSIQYKNLQVGNSETEKRNAVRSLMNVRMPRSISDDFLEVQDIFLQEEAKEKGIVTLAEIPTVKDAYESQRSFADRMSIWQGDITRLQVGAIVNAANSQMIGCFVPCHRCIDNAIHSAAGVQLRNECNHIMNQRRIRFGRQYEEPTGTATLTSAYNLPCKYVIHTVLYCNAAWNMKSTVWHFAVSPRESFISQTTLRHRLRWKPQSSSLHRMKTAALNV